MPYSKEHKERTRNNILHSAYTLFSSKGFDAVTVDAIMKHCSLTRGAFYAHFKSKSDLYCEALKFSAANSFLADNKPKDMASKEWLNKLLDEYLNIQHVRGERPCPLAFLSTDIVSREKRTKKTYTNSYINMNKVIMDYAGVNSFCAEMKVTSLTTMIIGAVSISRAIDDDSIVENILVSCRHQAGLILDEL